jgi:hypothetical protein
MTNCSYPSCQFFNRTQYHSSSSALRASRASSWTTTEFHPLSSDSEEGELQRKGNVLSTSARTFYPRVPGNQSPYRSAVTAQPRVLTSGLTIEEPQAITGKQPHVVTFEEPQAATGTASSLNDYSRNVKVNCPPKPTLNHASHKPRKEDFILLIRLRSFVCG